MSRRKLRKRISFFLYICIAFVSIFVCCLVTVANPSVFVKTFTSSECVEALRNDVALYASDMCKKNNISDDFVDDAISYDTMYHLQKAFVSGTLGASKQYNENAFAGMLEDFEADLEQSVAKSLDANAISADSYDGNGLTQFCQNIADYVESRIDFQYMNDVRHEIKRIKIISYIFIAVFVPTAAALIVVVSLKGGKSYKILQSIASSVLGASFMNVVVAAALGIVNATKDLVIYPLYIAGAFVDYFQLTVLTFTSCSAILFMVFLVLLVAGWKLKRSEKE